MATITNYIRLRGNMASGMQTIADTTALATDRLQQMRGTSGALGQTVRNLAGNMKSFVTGTLLAGGFMAAAGAAMSLQTSLLHTASAYADIQARLRLVVSSAQEAVQVNDMIYQSAQRARGGYLEMAGAVTQLSLSAKEAFPDPKEAVRFMEGIQKLFIIGGAPKENQKAAMLQLTQGLASGQLQGDEFRSISENAPMIQNIIAETMGVARGELKNLAAEGKVTADVIKAAILGNMGQIDAMFDTMPRKWSDHMTTLSNVAVKSFTPVYDQINGLANSEGVRQLMSGLSTGVVAMAGGLSLLLSGLAKIGEMAGIIFSSILQFVPVVTAGAIGMATAWAVYHAQLAASAVWQGVLIATEILLNGILAVKQGILAALTAGMGLYRAATLAVASAGSILALVTSFVSGNLLALAAIVAGVAVGAFLLWELATGNLGDTVASVMDFIIDATETGVNACISLVNGLLSVLNAAGKGLDSLFHFGYTEVGLVEKVNFQGAKKYSQAIREGNFMETVMGSLAPNVETGTLAAVMGMPDSIAQDMADTAQNTKSIKEAMDSTEEELRFLKEAAEREAINKYTTATVKIDVGGLQVADGGSRDFDGMMRRLRETLVEAATSGAEAVKQ